MITVMLLLAAGMLEPDGYTFEPETKNYRVQLPAKPDGTSSRSVSRGAVKSRVTTAELTTPDAVYSIQVTESPLRIDPTTLDDGIRRHAAANQGSLGAIRLVEVDGNPGRDFEWTARTNPDSKRSKSRWVVADQTLYQLQVTGQGQGALPAEAERFLNSLEIGPAKVAIVANPMPEEVDTVAPVVKDDAPEGQPRAVAKPPATPKPKKSNALPKLTIDRPPSSARAYSPDNLADLKRSFLKDRDGFHDIGPAGSVLVGVRVSYIERFGGYKVRSAQPIYRSGKSHYWGGVYGEVVGLTEIYIAKPGYAVGGLVTHTGLTVDGFGMVYMKVDGERLDSNDSYNSPWIGDEKGGSPGEVVSPGNLAVGLQGRCGKEVFALSLTVLK